MWTKLSIVRVALAAVCVALAIFNVVASLETDHPVSAFVVGGAMLGCAAVLLNSVRKSNKRD